MLHMILGLVAVALGVQGVCSHAGRLFDGSMSGSSLFLILAGCVALFIGASGFRHGSDRSILADLSSNLLHAKDDN